MDHYFDDQSTSLVIESYDAFYGCELSEALTGDVAFYSEIARETGGNVLEIGCGTGRVAFALLEGAAKVTGIDLSEGMLAIARRKATELPIEAQQRLTFIQQDQSELALDERFNCILVTARCFQYLLTNELQVKTLEAIHRHIEPGGRLVLDLFDPRLDLVSQKEMPYWILNATHEPTGRRFVREVVRTRFDYLQQIRNDLWRYTEIGPNGEVLRQEIRERVVRWTYRWELRHLLKICGFSVEAEYSDFNRSPPAYGKELLMVAKAE